LTGLEEVAELGDNEGSGGSGAEAEDYVGLDVVHSLVDSELLEVVLREDCIEVERALMEMGLRDWVRR
jgi:hypothetical protein